MLARPQDRSRADPRAPASVQPSSSGRYTIYGQIGAGGMATVQYAHFVGPGGFSRPVAIKRLHPHFATDPGFVSAFLDEARIAARIAHANVVATLDVIEQPDEVSVVMEYVHGESLAGLFSLAQARGAPLPCKIATSLMVGVLHGLHAAHETCSERGEPLGIVHRDVSPENILVGSDGVARLLDFGIAKAKGRSRTTPTGELKGKLGYMAPEQYRGEEVDRRVDVYGASVVLWEALTGHMLFDGTNDAAVVNAVMNGVVRAPSELAPRLPTALDALVLRGLARNRDERFESAREMALALERDVGVATQSEVSDWLQGLAGPLLQERAAALGQLRLRTHEHSTQDASELGTRRLALDLAGAPTRASVMDGAAPARHAQPAESGLRARGPAPGRRWALLLLLPSLLGLASWGFWQRDAAPARPATGADAPPPAVERSIADAPPAAVERSIAGAPPPAVERSITGAPPSAESHSLADATPPAERRSSGAASTPGGQRATQAAQPSSAGHAARISPPVRTDSPTPARSAAAGGGQRLRAPSAAKPKRNGQPPTGLEPRAKEARKKPDCLQPYVIDALGIRRWKRECL